MGRNVILLLTGLLIFVLAAILLGIQIDTSETTGAKANIGSFTGVRSINDLYPLIFAFAGVLVGLGSMGLGGAGLAGVGPTGGGGGRRRRR